MKSYAPIKVKLVNQIHTVKGRKAYSGLKRNLSLPNLVRKCAIAARNTGVRGGRASFASVVRKADLEDIPNTWMNFIKLVYKNTRRQSSARSEVTRATKTI